MRCKACNKIMKQYELKSIHPSGPDMDICSDCKISTKDAYQDNPSRRVQDLQNSTGFRDMWG